jgi:hypothetical protein
VPWLPLLLAAGFTSWLLSQFSRVIDAIHLNPDAMWAPVLIRDLDFGTSGGLIFVGEASHLTTLWFLNLTRTLPFSELIWDWTPYLTYLATLGLVAWACRQVAGLWPAAMTFVLGLTAEATVLLTVMAEGMRGHTFFADAALGAFLVLIATRPNLPRGTKWGAIAAAVVIVGAALASDPLFVVAGLAPFVGAPLVAWLLRRTRPARNLAAIAGGIAAVAPLLSALIWLMARSVGIRKNYMAAGYDLASPPEILGNLKEFVQHVLTLGNGYSSIHQTGILRIGQYVMAGVIVGAALWGFTVVSRTALRRGSEQHEDHGLILYTTFWLLSALGTFTAFALTSFASGLSDSSRYVIPVFFALSAIGPLWGRSPDWRRPAAAACIALFCLLSLAARSEMLGYERAPILKTLHEQGDRITAFLRGEGVRYGYGGYFTSHQLTVRSNLEFYSFPIIACQLPASDVICPFSVNTRTAWYVPRRGEKSFIIHDDAAPDVIAPAPTAALGPPSATGKFDEITVYVFDYDVARNFAPPCLRPATLFCPTE